jgi:hypothetical protein
MAAISLEAGERSMHEVIDEEELTLIERGRDKEVTLGPMMVAGLLIGLALLCGLCFGLGYSMGRGGGHDSPVAGQPPGAGAFSPASSSISKPKAAPQTIAEQPAAAESLPTAGASNNSGAAAAQTPGSISALGANSAQPVPALMVQIATLSHQEDADVLINALRKRGFEATVSSRDDGQLHVRIGPFNSLSEANTMREKLTNDGYNAVVQP